MVLTLVVCGPGAQVSTGAHQMIHVQAHLKLHQGLFMGARWSFFLIWEAALRSHDSLWWILHVFLGMVTVYVGLWAW
jgi:hypothetical protein